MLTSSGRLYYADSYYGRDNIASISYTRSNIETTKRKQNKCRKTKK